MRISLAFAVAALLMVCGCSKPAADGTAINPGTTASSAQVDKSALVGKYNAHVPDSGATDEQAKRRKIMADMTHLELNADDTYLLSAGGAPMEGKWTVSGGTVTLTAEKILGMSREDIDKQLAADTDPASESTKKKFEELKRPRNFSVSDNGDTLTAVDEKGSLAGVNFKKQK
jgi:hypothetical protein